MFYSSCNSLSDSRNAVLVRPWALKKSTVPTDYIAHVVLSCPIEFWSERKLVFHSLSRSIEDLPSDAKMIGQSGLEGSAKQKTSASPSEAS